MPDQKQDKKAPKVFDAVFTVNDRWEVISFNSEAEEITGLKSEDVIGKDCRSAFGDNERLQSLLDLRPHLAAGHTLLDYHIAIPNASNPEDSVHLLVTAIPIPDQDGRLTGAVIALHQVTYPCLIYPLVLDNIGDGVFTVDHNSRITSFNRAAERITGWSSRDVVGRHWGEFFHEGACGPPCLTKLDDPHKHLTNQPTFLIGKEGESIPISISCVPLNDPDGMILGYVVNFRDVTASMQQDLILKSVADGVFTVDHDMRITAFNRGAERITGWTADEVIGKPCSEVRPAFWPKAFPPAQ